MRRILLESSESLHWPFAPMLVDDDGEKDFVAEINFEDDHLEKRLELSSDPADARAAHLWIYGKPDTSVWRVFQPMENLRIQVNDDPDQEISFCVAKRFLFVRDHYQWIPFRIPTEWLVQGENTFVIYEAHDPDYRKSKPWWYNNLRVGIDVDTDHDRSWWFGTGASSCCVDMGRRAQDAPKPLLRDAPMIDDHRDRGYGECGGELMIRLEIIP